MSVQLDQAKQLLEDDTIEDPTQQIKELSSQAPDEEQGAFAALLEAAFVRQSTKE